jgi:hypothetical protein
MRYPPVSPDDPLDPLYQILRFQKGDLTDNPYADLFPGFRLLRNHGVSLQNHACSSTACVPSRSTIMTGQYSARSGVTQTEGMFKSDTPGCRRMAFRRWATGFAPPATKPIISAVGIFPIRRSEA